MGAGNPRAIRRACARAKLVIAAWGNEAIEHPTQMCERFFLIDVGRWLQSSLLAKVEARRHCLIDKFLLHERPDENSNQQWNREVKSGVSRIDGERQMFKNLRERPLAASFETARYQFLNVRDDVGVTLKP